MCNNEYVLKELEGGVGIIDGEEDSGHKYTVLQGRNGSRTECKKLPCIS